MYVYSFETDFIFQNPAFFLKSSTTRVLVEYSSEYSHRVPSTFHFFGIEYEYEYRVPYIFKNRVQVRVPSPSTSEYSDSLDRLLSGTVVDFDVVVRGITTNNIRLGVVLRDVVYTTNTTKILQACSTDFQNCTTKNEHTLDIMEIF